MKDATIKKYEAAGFKRWTKNGLDRLYIDAEALGLEVERYGTGNVKSATWQGEKVSNADARRILASKAYIDVETGELHVSSDFEKYGMPTVEEMARELVESIEDGEPQPEQLDDAAAQELAEDAATVFETKCESFERMCMDEASIRYGVGWEPGDFHRIQLSNGLTVWLVLHDCADGWVCFVEADGSTVIEGHEGGTPMSALAKAYEAYASLIDESGTSGIYACEPYYAVTVTGGEEEHEYIYETMADAWDELATIKNGCGIRSTLGNAVRLERRQRIFAKTGTAGTREWLASSRNQREA
jgi:hypothetical protein